MIYYRLTMYLIVTYETQNSKAVISIIYSFLEEYWMTFFIILIEYIVDYVFMFWLVFIIGFSSNTNFFSNIHHIFMEKLKINSTIFFTHSIGTIYIDNTVYRVPEILQHGRTSVHP